MSKTAVIIGAGPAGLTAGLELLRRSDVKPVLLEASQEIGGISRTIKYKGNRMDIGGHRFFSKSDRVMQWWVDLMPPDVGDAGSDAALRLRSATRGRRVWLRCRRICRRSRYCAARGLSSITLRS